MTNTTKSSKIRTGTLEWSDHSLNIQTGCENGCRYCYARYNAVWRFKYCLPNEWNEPRIDHDKVDRNFRFEKGWWMFPTTHDITERNISESLVVIRKLLDSANRVLVVSKPSYDIISLICETLKSSYDKNFLEKHFMFRFTIGSTDSVTLHFWEPGAPDFEERVMALRYAFEAGFNTSVSCEPFLDYHPEYVYRALSDYITDTFWLGLLRNFDQRVVLDGVTDYQMDRFVKPLRLLVDKPVAIRAICRLLEGMDSGKVRLKDSIRAIIR